MIIAANKADLCLDLDILKKIPDTVVPCSAETELLLRKATKAGILILILIMDLKLIRKKKFLHHNKKHLI